MDYQLKFELGLPYERFLETHATAEQQRRFALVDNLVTLQDSQRERLGSFVRHIHLLCMAGAWCGDCVEQVPILNRLCNECSCLNLRLIDRDADPELSEHLQLCGSARVPQVVFLNEDFEFLGRMGDRTLSKYRRMAETLTGAACPTGLGIDGDLTQTVAQEWLDEIERIHWIARLSPRLRERHDD